MREMLGNDPSFVATLMPSAEASIVAISDSDDEGYWSKQVSCVVR